MIVTQTIAETRKTLDRFRSLGKTIGFTPTMGALHEGHLALAHQAAKENDISVMSIFVNPTQFGPKEDFSAYPRNLTQDSLLAEKSGVDLLFFPSTEEMYTPGFSTYVEETEISQGLCGARRPGHFRGVCTVVLKLFNAIQPDRAYFGQKDAQQLRVLEKMVEDLNLPLSIVGCPTIRENDGLAMSSRNTYLTPEEREEAPHIFSALSKGARLFRQGEYQSAEIQKTVLEHLKAAKLFELQYLEIRAWKDFAPIEQVNEKSVMAMAGFFGTTRLIDNILLEP